MPNFVSSSQANDIIVKITIGQAEAIAVNPKSALSGVKSNTKITAIDAPAVINRLRAFNMLLNISNLSLNEVSNLKICDMHKTAKATD